MTANKVVEDAVLGRFARKSWDLLRRIMNGSVNANRALFFLQRAIEGHRRDYGRDSSSWGIYVLESRWSNDKGYREFATISLEKGDSSIPFEQLLTQSRSKHDKEYLLMVLREIYNKQVSMYGPHRMVRLYRVTGLNFSGYSPETGLDGTLENETVDLVFNLKPLFDFDSDMNPIPNHIEGTK